MAKTETATTRSVEELEALLAAKEAEIAQLQKAAEKKTAEKKEETAPASGYSEDVDKLKKRVTIRLPLQGSNKEPLFARFGDETFTIRRGVDVSIPYYIWLHLEESKQAEDAIQIRMNDLTGDFTDKVEAYKL